MSAHDDYAEHLKIIADADARRMVDFQAAMDEEREKRVAVALFPNIVAKLAEVTRERDEAIARAVPVVDEAMIERAQAAYEATQSEQDARVAASWAELLSNERKSERIRAALVAALGQGGS